MPEAEDRAPLDRDALRQVSQIWTDKQRRLLVERVIDHLPDPELERVLGDLVHLDQFRCRQPDPRPLADRVAEHVAATRRGDFLGDYILRNRHGEREPEETRAWVATMWHLFDLAKALVQDGGSDAPWRALVDLVDEVDQRPDELVVFEDSCAQDEMPLSAPSVPAR